MHLGPFTQLSLKGGEGEKGNHISFLFNSKTTLFCCIKTFKNTPGHDIDSYISKTHLTDQKVHAMTKLKLFSPSAGES